MEAGFQYKVFEGTVIAVAIDLTIKVSILLAIIYLLYLIISD
jgi:hypothetical protein